VYFSASTILLQYEDGGGGCDDVRGHLVPAWYGGKEV